MLTITACTARSEILQAGAYTVTNAIKPNTTPDEFDRVVAQGQPEGYELKNGGRCGWNAIGKAAYEGNAKLVEHIVKIGGPDLINLGNEFGWTPLFAAANCENSENGCLAARTLIDLGANPNLATTSGCNDSRRGETLQNATPLWAAAEKTRNLPLVRLLLENGAIVPERLSPAGRQIIDSAKQEIETSAQRPSRPVDFV